MSTPKWPHEYLCLYEARFRDLMTRLNTGGYLVYRRAFEEARCGLERGAEAHKVAVFVTEAEASNYCEYRNHMTVKHGTDDTAVIRFAGKLGEEVEL